MTDKIREDHLGIELLFLTSLIDKYLVMDDEACKGEMKKEIRRFINQHILSWIYTWNNKVQDHAVTLCFKGIGTLILACSEDIFNLMDPDTPTGLAVDNIKN